MSHENRLHLELCKLNEINYKLTKQIKDLKIKLASSDTIGGNGIRSTTMKSTSASKIQAGDADDGDLQYDMQQHLDKLCQNDKVIQCIDKLLDKNDIENSRNTDIYKQK